MKLVEHTYRMPLHWACAFINGDTSGLDEQDLAQYNQAVDSIVDEIGNAHAVALCREEEFETGHSADYPPNALAGGYADYVFLAEPEPTTTVPLECFLCKQIHDVTVPTAGLAKLQLGAHVQDAFPDLPKEQRELFISKTCPQCWDEIFGVEE